MRTTKLQIVSKKMSQIPIFFISFRIFFFSPPYSLTAQPLIMIQYIFHWIFGHFYAHIKLQYIVKLDFRKIGGMCGYFTQLKYIIRTARD